MEVQICRLKEEKIPREKVKWEAPYETTKNEIDFILATKIYVMKTTRYVTNSEQKVTIYKST